MRQGPGVGGCSGSVEAWMTRAHARSRPGAALVPRSALDRRGGFVFSTNESALENGDEEARAPRGGVRRILRSPRGLAGSAIPARNSSRGREFNPVVRDVAVLGPASRGGLNPRLKVTERLTTLARNRSRSFSHSPGDASVRPGYKSDALRPRFSDRGRRSGGRSPCRASLRSRTCRLRAGRGCQLPCRRGCRRRLSASPSSG